ncbi:hypothetical protein Zm00014a_003857 [Zea mays]|uniref:PHD-type zinc finger plants domain-containing protein n=1 Tax=Zea mays TaxID=4577 RepID=A0A3L6F4F6_MAIZE|nr:hypothetical protein Zm00014a_003857 [Zea mays]
MAGSTTTTAVCSMCGDVGFPDKLFRCARCRRRFQHSYCTNYYGDAAPAQLAGAGVCDWCLRDDVGGGTKKRQHSSASAAAAAACGGKQPHRQAEEEEEAAAAAGWRRSAQHQPASSSFPPSGGCSKVTGGSEHAEGGRRPRRYKLLKDVLC